MTREEIINGLIHIAAGNWDENSMATITEAITILESQPALPGGLEEAAMRDSLDYVDSIPDGGTDKHPWNDHDVEKAYYDGMLTGAKWQAEQRVKMPKWKHPEAKYQYPEALTRIMDEYGDWHYGISEGHLNPDCEYISLAELSLMTK